MRLARTAACRSAAVMLVAGVLTTSCSTQVAFRVDDRVSFTTPKDRATVSLPLRLDWDVRDFTGSFAVFVDQAPVPPGKPLAYIARKDTRCKRSAGCPDKEYLASQGVYTTNSTDLMIERLPRDTKHPDRRERHRAVVVLLDAAGKRIGESAYEIAFDVSRSSQ